MIGQHPSINPRIDVDATLKMWPAPPRAEPLWEERAHAIVRAALSENKNPQLLDALLSAPPLLREPGELSAAFADGAAEPRSKRTSLREMAERHSSRVLLLKMQQEEAAAKANDVGEPAAMPARTPDITAAGRPASTAASASAFRAEIAQLPAKKRGSGGFVAGAAIAAMGIAAAFAITQIDRLTPPAMAPARVEARQDQPAHPPLPEPAPPREASAQAEPPAENPAAPPAPVAASKAPRFDVAAPLPSTAPELAQGPSTAPTAQAKPEGTETPDKSGGASGENPLRIEDTPAQGIDPNSNIPQQPAQGSIAPALRSVMGGAKKCVAGADDVSNAAITFGSNGAVKSVAVTGWAAANGATDCIKSALKGANVGPFWKPSFTVNVTLKP